MAENSRGAGRARVRRGAGLTSARSEATSLRSSSFSASSDSAEARAPAADPRPPGRDLARPDTRRWREHSPPKRGVQPLALAVGPTSPPAHRQWHQRTARAAARARPCRAASIRPFAWRPGRRWLRGMAGMEVSQGEWPHPEHRGPACGPLVLPPGGSGEADAGGHQSLVTLRTSVRGDALGDQPLPVRAHRAQALRGRGRDQSLSPRGCAPGRGWRRR